MIASTLAIALDLAAANIPVFPCDANKKPAISTKEGGRGFHDATTDSEAVRRLFHRRSAILVGVPTGERSGFDVLDLDYRNGASGWENANLHRIPETRTHATRSGGRHLLFMHASGVRNSASAVARGVDVRGEGGYIIMPPSPGYSVVSDAPIAHWPDWLLTLVLPKPKAAPPRSAEPPPPISSARLEAIKQHALDRLRRGGDGQKHFALRNAALLLGGIQARAGFSDQEAWHMLRDALSASVQDWNAAERTARWGLECGRNRPLHIEPDTAPASDPRRKETRVTAFRLLRIGVDDAELIAALHDQNRRRRDPLPEFAITNDGHWAACTYRKACHAA